MSIRVQKTEMVEMAGEWERKPTVLAHRNLGQNNTMHARSNV